MNSANDICVYAMPTCALKHVCFLSALMPANLPTIEVYMNTEIVCVVFNKSWSISKAEQGVGTFQFSYLLVCNKLTEN